MTNRYIIKGWFSNGHSEGGANTLEDAIATWQRIIATHRLEPFLERVEIWDNLSRNIIAIYDASGVKELTPAIEQLAFNNMFIARGRREREKISACRGN
jgi:hypothetical protein